MDEILEFIIKNEFDGWNMSCWKDKIYYIGESYGYNDDNIGICIRGLKEKYCYMYNKWFKKEFVRDENRVDYVEIKFDEVKFNEKLNKKVLKKIRKFHNIKNIPCINII